MGLLDVIAGELAFCRWNDGERQIEGFESSLYVFWKERQDVNGREKAQYYTAFTSAFDELRLGHSRDCSACITWSASWPASHDKRTGSNRRRNSNSYRQTVRVECSRVAFCSFTENKTTIGKEDNVC